VSEQSDSVKLELALSQAEGRRWEKGIPHDPRSKQIVEMLAQIDFHVFDDHFCWKVGGDGDNGEALMYELDVYFELHDKGLIPKEDSGG
jgi:hypothetical protein